MSIAFWCVLGAILLPYVTVGIAKWSRDYDNAAPREWLATRTGAARRAHSAHLNHFESLPGFAAAVIIAHLAGATQGWVDALSVAYLALRIGYTAAYVGDRPTLRSLLWMAALGCVIALFVAAAAAR